MRDFRKARCLFAAAIFTAVCGMSAQARAAAINCPSFSGSVMDGNTSRGGISLTGIRATVESGNLMLVCTASGVLPPVSFTIRNTSACPVSVRLKLNDSNGFTQRSDRGLGITVNNTGRSLHEDTGSPLLLSDNRTDATCTYASVAGSNFIMQRRVDVQHQRSGTTGFDPVALPPVITNTGCGNFCFITDDEPAPAPRPATPAPAPANPPATGNAKPPVPKCFDYEVLDKQNNICIKKVVPKCFDYEVLDKKNNVCVKKQQPPKCAKGFTLKNNKCVKNPPSCAVGKHYDNGKKTCVSNCASNKKWDNHKKQCVKK